MLPVRGESYILRTANNVSGFLFELNEKILNLASLKIDQPIGFLMYRVKRSLAPDDAQFSVKADIERALQEGES